MGDAVKGRVWFERDFPVLLAAVEMCQQSTYNQATTHQVAAATGLELSEVVKAVSNLKEKYIHVVDQSSGSERDFIITGATDAGLIATDVWPSTDALAERLVAAIEQALAVTPKGSPKATTLQGFLAATKDVTTGTAAGVLSALLAQALGIPPG